MVLVRGTFCMCLHVDNVDKVYGCLCFLKIHTDIDSKRVVNSTSLFLFGVFHGSKS